MNNTKTSIILPFAISLLGIASSTSYAVEQGHVLHEKMVQRKTEKICGSDNACIERMREMMDKRYEIYRKTRLKHCKEDQKCKDGINKNYPKQMHEPVISGNKH